MTDGQFLYVACTTGEKLKKIQASDMTLLATNGPQNSYGIGNICWTGMDVLFIQPTGHLIKRRTNDLTTNTFFINYSGAEFYDGVSAFTFAQNVIYAGCDNGSGDEMIVRANLSTGAWIDEFKLNRTVAKKYIVVDKNELIWVFYTGTAGDSLETYNQAGTLQTGYLNAVDIKGVYYDGDVGMYIATATEIKEYNLSMALQNTYTTSGTIPSNVQIAVDDKCVFIPTDDGIEVFYRGDDTLVNALVVTIAGTPVTDLSKLCVCNDQLFTYSGTSFIKII
jgi:hypothetical protein